jgi:hypothetical protein
LMSWFDRSLYCKYVQSIWWSVYNIHMQYLIDLCPVRIQSMWLITIQYTYRECDWSLSCTHTWHLIGPYPVHIQNIWLVTITYTIRAFYWSVHCKLTEQLIGQYTLHIQSCWFVTIQYTCTEFGAAVCNKTLIIVMWVLNEGVWSFRMLIYCV